MAQRSAFAECPACGSRNLRVSEPRGFLERFKSFFGYYQFRCRKCDHRFQTGILTLSEIRFARCPKCYRAELSTWSEQYYNPPWRVRSKLKLGATPYRCEVCRCNFASFRACKERYSWRKQKPPTTGVANHPG